MRLASNPIQLPDDVQLEGSKRAILEAALGLFAQNNYAATSIRDIASAAGLKPATLYAHYKSKEEMLVTLVHIGYREHHRLVRDAVRGGATTRDKVVEWVKAHALFHATYPMLAATISLDLHSLPTSKITEVLVLRDQSIELMTGNLHRGVAEGIFSIGHEVMLAAAAIGAMGLRLPHWYSKEQPYSIEDVQNAYADFALRILGAD
nr:TetR/AcrR family transcriptional regulator [Spongiibacter thalassae]